MPRIANNPVANDRRSEPELYLMTNRLDVVADIDHGRSHERAIRDFVRRCRTHPDEARWDDNPNRWTAMHSLLTCRRPPLEAVMALHDAEPSVLAGKGATDLWDRPPLYYAVEWNDVPDPDHGDDDTDEVSSSAAASTFRFVVDVSGGEAMDAPDKNRRTPLTRLWEKSLEDRCRRRGVLSSPPPTAADADTATSREDGGNAEESKPARDGVVCVNNGSGSTGGNDNSAPFGTTGSSDAEISDGVCSDCCSTGNSHAMLRRLLGGEWIKMEYMLRSRSRSLHLVGEKMKAEQEQDDFPILRAALSLRHCPRGLLAVLVRFFADQAAEGGEGGDVRLPLHLALANSVGSPAGSSPSPCPDGDSDRDRPTVIELLLRAHPGAAAVPDPEDDGRGRLPLAVAVETGLDWEGVIEPLLDAYPPSVRIRQPVTTSQQWPPPLRVARDDRGMATVMTGDASYLFPPFLIAALAARRDGAVGSSSDALVERAEEAERAWHDSPTLGRRTVLRARREAVRRDLSRLTTIYRLLLRDPSLIASSYQRGTSVLMGARFEEKC